MFKFSFDVDKDENCVLKLEEKEQRTIKAENNITHVKCRNARKIVPTLEMLHNSDKLKSHCLDLEVGNIKIKYIPSAFVIENATSKKQNQVNGIEMAEQANTDLIPGVYEGGAKIWECTMDLLTYISQNLSESFNGKQILDLGCGSGVSGIYSYKLGARNSAVLKYTTIPNMLLNMDKTFDEDIFNLKKLTEDVEFYSGDWAKYTEIACSIDKFDIILTSETIYNPTNYQKLLDTFDCKLKPDGRVLLAAKSYYFGIGGGTRQFENLIVKDNRFKSKVLWCSENGIVREIIEIKRI